MTITLCVNWLPHYMQCLKCLNVLGILFFFFSCKRIIFIITETHLVLMYLEEKCLFPFLSIPYPIIICT